MTQVFLYGTLRDTALAALVMGARVPEASAWLPGHRVAWAEGAPYPLIGPDPASTARGGLVDCTEAPEALARMDFYEGVWGYVRRAVTVETEAGPVSAQVYWPPGSEPPLAEAFDLSEWATRHGALNRAVATELFALRGHRPDEEIARRVHLISIRAQARLNAQATMAPTSLRRTAVPGDVTVSAVEHPWAGFFAIEEYALTHRRFDGGVSPPLHRSAFVSGDAATVLPYDPVRDRVLLVEQFRVGPFVRGDRQPWSLEAIAGRIDAGETPAQAARREAGEEAGLTLSDLIALPGYYPSPAAKAEFIYPFLALADLPDSLAGTGGLEEEDEDIRSHLVPFADLERLTASGEIANAPLLVSLFHLGQRREALRSRG